MFSGSFLTAFYKLFVPGSSMAQATAQNAELHAVLDGAQQAPEQPSPAAEDGFNADASMDLYCECYKFSDGHHYCAICCVKLVVSIWRADSHLQSGCPSWHAVAVVIASFGCAHKATKLITLVLQGHSALCYQPQPTHTSPLSCLLLTAEHLARLRAEAEVQDKAARLRVAQEQLAEYATDKSAAAAAVLEQAAAVEALLQRLMGTTDSGPAGPEVAALAEQLGRLKQQLADGALEAKAFAEQQRADVERLKRSSEQVLARR